MMAGWENFFVQPMPRKLEQFDTVSHVKQIFGLEKTLLSKPSSLDMFSLETVSKCYSFYQSYSFLLSSFNYKSLAIYN